MATSSWQLTKAAGSDYKEMTDEVDTDRIPRPAMKAVREYFGDAQDEEPAPAAPAAAEKK